jgi:hypothetical protein
MRICFSIDYQIKLRERERERKKEREVRKGEREKITDSLLHYKVASVVPILHEC